MRETERKQKATKDKSELLSLFPEAVRMFHANEVHKRLFLKDHAREILVIAFKHNGKGKKDDLLQDLVKLNAQDIEECTLYIVQ